MKCCLGLIPTSVNRNTQGWLLDIHDGLRRTGAGQLSSPKEPEWLLPLAFLFNTRPGKDCEVLDGQDFVNATEREQLGC